ncbi:MAG TPA: zinc ribbon domain-containing protein [Candidatus Binataceae bacterium]|nr:zinc ribbon domain-containing protein [Candidatus Binataceae bacterium]
MPIYEYRCDDCGQSFESFVMPGRTADECPDCHGAHLKREMSVFAARDGAAMRAASSAGNGSSGPAGGCCGGGCGCA